MKQNVVLLYYKKISYLKRNFFSQKNIPPAFRYYTASASLRPHAATIGAILIAPNLHKQLNQRVKTRWNIGGHILNLSIKLNLQKQLKKYRFTSFYPICNSLFNIQGPKLNRWLNILLISLWSGAVWKTVIEPKRGLKFSPDCRGNIAVTKWRRYWNGKRAARFKVPALVSLLKKMKYLYGRLTENYGLASLGPFPPSSFLTHNYPNQ